jgi:SAM-dependent methyltransferase
VRPVELGGLYLDGRHYDRQNAGLVEDIPFFLRQAERHGDPLLELACGTGRLTLPLAEAGFAITGLDLTPEMLAEAERKAAARGLRVEWVQGDCRAFRLDRSFRLIFLAFNSLAHLHDRESFEGLAACVRAHLAPGGRFILDYFNPSLRLLTRDSEVRYPVVDYPDPDGRGRVFVSENSAYDGAAQLNRIRWHFQTGDDPAERAEELDMRIYFPQELDALLHYNGFEVEAKYGDYDETPFRPSSPRQLVVCRG